MVFCYTIVSSWTCWNALCKSVAVPCVSAGEISETQELLPSYWWKSEQSSTAVVHPWRAGCGERGAWAADLPLAMQNNSDVLVLMVWTAAASDQKRECSPRLGKFTRILQWACGDGENEPVLGIYRWPDHNSSLCNAAPKLMCLILVVWVSQLGMW